MLLFKVIFKHYAQRGSMCWFAGYVLGTNKFNAFMNTSLFDKLEDFRTYYEDGICEDDNGESFAEEYPNLKTDFDYFTMLEDAQLDRDGVYDDGNYDDCYYGKTCYGLKEIGEISEDEVNILRKFWLILA